MGSGRQFLSVMNNFYVQELNYGVCVVSYALWVHRIDSFAAQYLLNGSLVQRRSNKFITLGARLVTS